MRSMYLLVLLKLNLYYKNKYISFTLYPAQQGRQREPFGNWEKSVKTLCQSQFSAILWSHYVLSGGNQHHALLHTRAKKRKYKFK